MQTMNLPVKLTEIEILASGQALASTIREIDNLELDKSEAAKEAGLKIKRAREHATLLARVLASGTEMRDVEIRVVRNSEARTMETYRIDTDELVHSRGLTIEELQENLFSVEITEQKASG